MLRKGEILWRAIMNSQSSAFRHLWAPVGLSSRMSHGDSSDHWLAFMFLIKWNLITATPFVQLWIIVIYPSYLHWVDVVSDKWKHNWLLIAPSFSVLSLTRYFLGVYLHPTLRCGLAIQSIYIFKIKFWINFHHGESGQFYNSSETGLLWEMGKAYNRGWMAATVSPRVILYETFILQVELVPLLMTRAVPGVWRGCLLFPFRFPFA